METKKSQTAFRRVLITLAFYLSVILAALILGVTHQIAGWVAQVAIALSLLGYTKKEIKKVLPEEISNG